MLAPAVLGHPLGLIGRLAMVALSGAVGALTLRFLENPLRYAPPLRRSPLGSIAVGGIATAMAACVGVALLERIPNSVGHGARVAPMAINAMPPPTGDNIEAYDTAVKAAVRTSTSRGQRIGRAQSRPVEPDTLTRRYASREKRAVVQRLPAHAFPKRATRVRDGRCRFDYNGCPDRRFDFRDDDSGVPAGRRAATLATRTDGQGSLLGDRVAGLRLSSAALVEYFDHCEQWRTEIIARLHAEHPRLVVVSMWRGYGISESLSGLRSYDPAWLDGLTRLVRDLRGTGAKVLVLGPIPDPRFLVPLCLSANLDDVTACALRRATSVNESGIAAESAATTAGGGQYSDLTDLFCTTDLCPVIVGNTLAYMDETHTTLEYSRQLAPVMGALADRTLAHN